MGEQAVDQPGDSVDTTGPGDPDAGEEIVFALVGAIGTDLKAASLALAKALADVRYRAVDINVIDLAIALPQWSASEERSYDKRMHARMDCGNRCREDLNREDALALLSIAGIRKRRGGAKALPRTAYILRSLKRPEEVETLRKAYGQSCYVIAVHCPQDRRMDQLADRIAGSCFGARDDHRGQAIELMRRDLREPGKTFGQNLRDTFALADLFLDGSSLDSLRRSAARSIEIVFGHPWRTPTREEFGMFQAYGAALRSASPGRQVGAAITREGDVVALGTNEVPRAFGGQYWEEDGSDGRDHRRDGDSTKRMTHEIFADLLARLKRQGWLREDKVGSIADLVDQAVRHGLLDKMPAGSDDPPSLADRASLLGIIEFMRAVHAEMASLVSAARRGISVDGGHLFSTAFPCHECARHIVGAGIRRVYFIEPYPKSRVAEMYDDSIAIDEEDKDRVVFRAFTGIAPRLYTTVFEMPKRRGTNGAYLEWDDVKGDALPRRRELLLSPRELDFVEILDVALHAKVIEI